MTVANLALRKPMTTDYPSAHPNLFTGKLFAKSIYRTIESLPLETTIF
jgi:hypothetical protein